MGTSIKKLNKRYRKICTEYVELFAKKHDVDFEFWVADIFGEVAGFGDYYFNFSDIVYDVNTNQPKGLIFSWQDHCLDFDRTQYINFYSYSKGLRINEIK